MKKKSLLVLLFAFVLSVAMLMTACGGGQKESAKPDDNAGKQEQQTEEKTTELTLEEYVKTDSSVAEAVEKAAEESGVVVEFHGNELLYLFDLSKMEGYTEDLVRNENVIAALENGLEDGKQTFGGISADIEKQTGIKGIMTVVQYNWEDDVLVSRTFTAADAE